MNNYNNLILPYVYKITNNNTGEFYIGSRYQNVKLNLTPNQDIGIKYFTSGKLKKMFKNTPELFIIDILLSHDNYKEIYRVEQELIKEHITNPLCMNKQYNDISGKIVYSGIHDIGARQRISKSKKGKPGHKHTDERKKLIGDQHRGKVNSEITNKKISEKNKGFVAVKDANGQTHRVIFDDPRIQTGELVGVNKGRTNVRDSEGNIFMVMTDDPRIQTGELVGVNKGRKMKHKNKRKTVTCPYCLKTGDVSGMSGYHFDKCKLKKLS